MTTHLTNINNCLYTEALKQNITFTQNTTLTPENDYISKKVNII